MFAVDYGREALDFIEGLEAYHRVPDAMNAIEAAFGRFGFETIIVAGLPNPDQQFAQMVLAKRWPTEWFRIYTENNYDRVDPVVRLCRQSINPFEWSEAPYDAELEPGAAEVMNPRGEPRRRLRRGIEQPADAVEPVHRHQMQRRLAARIEIEMDAAERDRGLVAGQPVDRHDEAMRHAEVAGEREVIAWASQGKSAWEIGEILHITQRTAEEHLATAARKLGAVNRTHAVAIAIRSKIISF